MHFSKQYLIRFVWGLALTALLFSGSLSAKVNRLRSFERLTPARIKQGLVLIRVSTVNFDLRNPWVKEAGQRYSVVGLVLPGKQILVLANDVHNASLLEVRKFSSYEKVTARVTRLDQEVNLALLEPESPDFFNDLRPLPLGLDPRPGQHSLAVKVDDVFRVYQESVQVMEVNSVSDFGFTEVPAAVFRSREHFRRGGLLIRNNSVCGFMSFSSADRKLEAIMPSVLENFRKRNVAGRYAGFVSQGFELTGMTDPVLREFYKLPRSLKGPLISRVLPGTSAYGSLKEEDVLLNIDGVNLDNRGYYDDPSLGRQRAAILLSRTLNGRLRLPGESVPINVFRNGRSQALSLTLRSYNGSAERIPWHVYGPPPFLVESGLVFLELSVSYLKRKYGKNWNTASLELAYLLRAKRFYKKPATDRIVILDRVLPDAFNRGYGGLKELPVVSINDKPVQNLKHMLGLIRGLSEQGEKVMVVTLQGGRKIFLDLEKRDSINKRIQTRYNIPFLSRVATDSRL